MGATASDVAGINKLVDTQYSCGGGRCDAKAPAGEGVGRVRWENEKLLITF